MRVAIAGAGKVGRAIARELLSNYHQVLLIDRDPDKGREGAVSYTHLRAHETALDLVCRLLLVTNK